MRRDTVALDAERAGTAPGAVFLDGVHDLTLLDPARGSVVWPAFATDPALPPPRPWALGKVAEASPSLADLLAAAPPLGVLVSALAPLPAACDALARAGCHGDTLTVRFAADGRPLLGVEIIRPAPNIGRPTTVPTVPRGDDPGPASLGALLGELLRDAATRAGSSALTAVATWWCATGALVGAPEHDRGADPRPDALRQGTPVPGWPGTAWAAECEARILACAEPLPIDPTAYVSLVARRRADTPARG